MMKHLKTVENLSILQQSMFPALFCCVIDLIIEALSISLESNNNYIKQMHHISMQTEHLTLYQNNSELFIKTYSIKFSFIYFILSIITIRRSLTSYIIRGEFLY